MADRLCDPLVLSEVYCILFGDVHYRIESLISLLWIPLCGLRLSPSLLMSVPGSTGVLGILSGLLLLFG